MKNARWVKLARDLTRGISNGKFPLDSYLPTEMELCEQYKVSRYTVRLALADLTRLGYIKRWPRLGSRVVSTGMEDVHAQGFSPISDWDHLANANKRIVQLTSECVLDDELALQLECDPSLKLLRFSDVRSLPSNPDEPIVWTAVYVNAAFSRLPEIARLNSLDLMSKLMEQEYGERCTEVSQKISAVPLPEEAAQYLNASAGEPSLRILRHYLGNSRKILEISDSYHPGGRFTYTLNMSNGH